VTGYFSALAQHTGLGVAPVAIGSSGAFQPIPQSSAATLDAQRTAVTPPPEVEEITFTSARETANARGEGRPFVAADDTASSNRATNSQVGQESARAEHDTDRRSEHPRAEIDVPSDESRQNGPSSFLAAPAQRNDVPASAREQPRTVESTRLIAFESAEPTDAPAAPPGYSDREARVQIGEDDADPGTKPSAPRQFSVVEKEPLRPVADYRKAVQEPRAPAIERETLVRNYLKEVTEWVAQSPALDSAGLESVRETEQTEGAESAALESREASQVGLSRKTPSPSPVPSLDVQDLTLSIGTIKVVVEELPAAVATPQIAAPRNVGADRSASEPTRLSRYYLERW
jgi:hypothetical protein